MPGPVARDVQHLDARPLTMRDQRLAPRRVHRLRPACSRTREGRRCRSRSGSRSPSRRDPTGRGPRRRARAPTARTRARGSPAMHGQQRQRRGLAELGVVDPDRRQRRHRERGQRGVVEPDHGDVVGHGEPAERAAAIASIASASLEHTIAVAPSRSSASAAAPRTVGRAGERRDLARHRRHRPRREPGGGERGAPGGLARLDVLVLRRARRGSRSARARATPGARPPARSPPRGASPRTGRATPRRAGPASTTGIAAAASSPKRGSRPRRRSAGTRRRAPPPPGARTRAARTRPRPGTICSSSA